MDLDLGLDLDLPQTPSQWFKLRKNRRLFFWWVLHRLTTPLRVLPDFLVIGAMKAGTTSLFNYLAGHPQINPPFRKEIKYFDIHYPQGLGWYRAHFPVRFKMKAGILTGEATPYYLFHPLAAQRAARSLPRARLIVLLRNPVDRAFSHYNHMVRVGREPLSFEEALEREPERLAGEADRIAADPRYSTFKHLHYSYLARGRYLEQLQKWFACFPRAQIGIFQSEELFSSPAAAFARILAFLGLPEWDAGDYAAFKQGAYEKMDGKVRRQLAAYFKPYNRQLYDDLGRSFDWE